MGKKYQIQVGPEHTETMISGFLEPGQHIIKGKEIPVATRRVGVYGMPNGTECWGIRLDKDGKKPKVHLTVDDASYNGKIEFVDWGSNENIATAIRCRYIPGHTTLDKDYQDLRLKVQIAENSEYAGLIVLRHGYNEFDEVQDAAKVFMLKIHHFNPNSKTCNPESYPSWSYKEINQEEFDRKATSIIDKKFECIMLVNNAANNPASIKNLFEIVKGAEFDKVNREDSQEVFNSLKYFADQKPDIFATRISNYKNNVSKAIQKLKSYDAFDLTKDGFVAAGLPNQKKEPVMEGIPAKGEDMLDYAFNNYLQPEIYSGIEKITHIAEKIK